MQLILNLFIILTLLSGCGNNIAAPPKAQTNTTSDTQAVTSVDTQADISTVIPVEVQVEAQVDTQTNIVLPNFKAYYSLNKAGLQIAETVTEFSHDTNAFTYTTHSKTVGLAALFRDDTIMEQTVGKWNKGHIQPETYRYQRTGKKEKEKKIDFNWKNNEAVYEENNIKTTIELHKNTVDELTNQLAMMLDLMTHASKEKDEFSYPVIDDGLLKDRAFIVEGKETIQVEAGSFESVKIKRLRAKGGKRTTYFWCVPELYQLPVKIEHIESDGGKLSLELVKTEGFQKSVDIGTQ